METNLLGTFRVTQALLPLVKHSAAPRIINVSSGAGQLDGGPQGTTQIGASLHISASTIATHREHIMAKLNLENSRELVRRAVTWVHSEGGYAEP